ncbi:hypothetical protein [Homoserinibacter sp. GY 40078]|uniref:hypothetical protein n=1 Tax=Homoserinibacter sp. GY 40078 TaxID=2603275 RepID=UPI0011C968B2|nr:hypothetical protein [Homoserinibacter sp. GY 40078]TXK18591.1 hypothetical protein FVQ89_01160 [Homoserinibacter sp. GY 40078]
MNRFISRASVTFGAAVLAVTGQPAITSHEPLIESLAFQHGAASEEEVVYRLDIPDATDLSMSQLKEAASVVGVELRTVIFEGEEGVGQLMVVDGDTAETLESRAQQLFLDVDAEVPPIAGALVAAPTSLHEGAIMIGATSVELHRGSSTARTTATPSTASIDLPPVGGARFTNWGGYVPHVTNGWPGWLSQNDWDAYFPFTYRAEGFNINRCVQLVAGECLQTAKRAVLTQSIIWTGGSHTAYWPDSQNWGFEFGSAMYNYSLCGGAGSPTFTPGWWLNPVYAEWSTNVPSDAMPYQDVNREFDDCQTTTHELGIRYPSLLVAGAEYIYSVSSARNMYRPSSTYSASFQAVHDDCPPNTARDWLTHCMGLNELIDFPYGRQSATVINASNDFTFPGCARMYAGWAHPLSWFNGNYQEVPVPMGAPYDPSDLSFYDGCFSNDWL